MASLQQFQMPFVGDFNFNPIIDGAANNSTCGPWTSQRERYLERGVSEEVCLLT